MNQETVEKTYYQDGKLQMEIRLLNGIPNGCHREWYENGVLAFEMNVKNGFFDGIGKQWDENGKLLFTFEIKNGTGVFKQWIHKQKFFSEISFVDKKFTGKQKIYLKDGTILSEDYYIRNKKVSKKRYFEECKKDPELPRYDDMLINEEKDNNLKDHRTSPRDDSNDKFCENILSSGKAIEARRWLKGKKCYLGESMDDKETVKFIESFYKAGAVNVWIFDINEDELGVEYSGRIIIELPQNTKKREKLIKLSNKVTAGNGYEEEIDFGQKYIFLMLD